MTCEGKAAMGFGEMFPQDEKKHREEMAPFFLWTWMCLHGKPGTAAVNLS